MRKYILMLCLCSCLAVQAQRNWWPVRVLRAVGDMVDSMAVRGLDPRYIQAPERPWQVIARYNVSQMDLKMRSNFNDISGFENLTMGWEPRLRTQTSNMMGLWLGYRGYGLGYLVETGRRRGSFFTFGAMSGRYGINLRLRTFSAMDPEIRVFGQYEGSSYDETQTISLMDAIRVRTLIIDGYYMFNGRHFSYAAAYDQSVFQMRSAGSLMVGALWHNSSVRYNDESNIELVSAMHDIGVMKIKQGSIGVGYTYNWVPARGLLFNVLVMPMLTLLNRQEVELYNCDFEYDDIYGDYVKVNDFSYRETKSYNSKVSLTYNARASLTYNWKRFFLNAYGQWNNYRFGTDDNGSGHINDWYINTSLGVRF